VVAKHLEHSNNMITGRPRLPNVITIAIGRPDVLLLTIPTSQARYAPAAVIQFDIGDLDIVERHHWSVGKGGRPCCHLLPTRDTIYLARLLVGALPGQRTCAINRDATDMRRANIKICKPDPKTLAKRGAGL
jgi:hypothetical protein